MTSTPTIHQKRWLVSGMAIALGILTLIVFLPARHGEFLNWDDLSYVVENDHVKGGITWKGIIWAFTSSHSANWHPLTWISHALDCQVYGLQPGGHHVTNVVFHSANAALLFLLLRLLTGSFWRSALAAAIFALHPLRVESVAWLAERKDVLSTFFGLLALITYGRFVQCKMKNIECNTAWYSAALVLFALGLMSKPMLVTWPFLMLLLDFWPLHRVRLASRGLSLECWNAWQRLLVEKWPFFAMSLASGIVTICAQKQGGAVASFEHLNLTSRLQNAATACAEYLARLFWPVNLSPIYPYPAQWEMWWVAGAVALLAGLSMAVWLGRRRFPCGIIGWFWFLATLVPVIGIVQVGSQAFADRYTYVPQIGLVWLLVWLTAEVTERLRLPGFIIGLAAAAILATLMWRTTEQLTVWKNTERLFRHALKFFPNNALALNGLGGHYIRIGRIAEGKSLLEQVIQLEPSFVEARGALADSLDGEGHFSEAASQYEAALAVQPQNASLLNNLAWLRAACPDASIRSGAKAVRLAMRACELTSYAKPLFIGTLAAAQAEAGDFPAATVTAERAAALATALRLNETARRNRELMELYRQGKAAHGGPPKTF